ncbi:hypothetical protein JCM10049v2_005897 [Rhodotorula toruloides]
MPKRSRPSGPYDTLPSSSARGGAWEQSKETRTLQGATGSRKLKFKDEQRPPKRSRTAVLPLLSLEGSLSEEILLRCLSFLGAQDLAVVARVSSAWYRLSQDPQLWRDLYLRTYASAATRRQAVYGGGIERNRPWRELYKVSTNWRSGTARASTLGKSLRKAVLPEAPPPDLAELSSEGGEPVAGPSERRPPVQLPPTRLSSSRQDVETILQFHQHYILSASRLPTSDPSIAPPSVTVHHTLPSGGSAVVGSFSSTRLADFFANRPGFRPPLAITDVRLDEAHGRNGSILCAVFYSTGQWSLFRLTFASSTSPSTPFEAEEVYASLAIASPPSHPLSAAPASPPSSSPFHPVSLARLYAPLLVTLSDSLTLRFMRLDEAEDGKIEVDEAETPLQSREDWAPVVLDVSKESNDGAEKVVWLGRKREEKDEQRFKVSLAYSMSVFPASWTVGIQEFTIEVPPARRAALPTARILPKMRISARHATAAPIHSPLPSTPRRSAPLASPSPPSMVPTSRSPVTSIEHSHPFIVTSRVDNTLDVYEIVSRPTPASAPPAHTTPSRPSTSRIRLNLHPSSGCDSLSPLSPPLRVIHRRTLFGHTARVASVALLPESRGGETNEAGVKCVSAGDDGVVKVWHLSPLQGEEGRKRRRREGEEVVDVRAVPGAEQREEEERTEWQRLRQKRRRWNEEEGERPQKVKRVWVDEDKIVVVGADSASSTSSAPASPASSSQSEGSNSRKQVCFHPLALCISTAPDGEIEKAMAQAAKEELAHRRRMLGIKTYCIEAPALGDMTSSTWHSVVNGFTSSLGPYLSSPSSSRARDDSPDRQTGRRGSRSTSPSTTRAREEDDPAFIPNPPTRLTVRLPALKRSCSTSCATRTCKSILRKKPERGCSLPPIDDEPEASTSSQRLPHFPPLSPTTSPAPALARSSPLAVPDRPNRRRSSSLPATVSPDATLVPLLPCCAACEHATLYGCSPPSSIDSYTEKWSAGALKKREEEKRAEEEREKYRAEADRIRKSHVFGSRCGTRRVGFEREWREKEEEWATSHLGELVERQGGVDELDRVKRRDGRERRSFNGENEENGTVGEEHEEEEEKSGGQTAGSLSRATTTVAEPAKHEGEKDVEKLPPTLPALAPEESTPPADIPAAAQRSQPTPPPTATSASTTASAPTYAPPRPPPVRRLSSAAASFSQRLASAVGSGLTHVPVNAPGVRTAF